MKNWFDHILFQTRSQPEKPALVMENRVVTYAMLEGAIASCAHRIAAQRIAGEAPVAVLVKNPIRHLTLCLALFRLGIVGISLEHEQAGIKNLRFAAVLGDNEAAPFVDPGNRLIEVTDVWFGPGPGGGDLPPGFSAASQTCRISLTSGATGAPKSVAHSVVDIGRRVLSFIDVNWDVALCLPGLSSNWGFTTACAALATGRTLCLTQSPFQAVRMIELFSIDFVMASAEQLLALVRVARKSRAQVRSLRTIWFGGSIPTRALLEAAMAHLCNNVLCRYAASETGVVAQAPARDVLADPGLVGYPLPGVEVAILGPAGERCPAGAVGAIKVRIADEAIGHLRPELGDTPWIDLGDAGWLGVDGQLHVIGRTADAVPGTGEAQRLSPIHEIEHILRLGWDAADVAAMIEEASGARARLFVGIVGNKDVRAGALAALLQARGFNYEVAVFHLAAVPRGANGKVSRQELKALMLASTGRAF